MLFYRYGAVDRADNWNWTEEIIAPLANVVPVFSDLPTWNVTESTDAEFDLTTYINDHNDDAFTIECLDDNITVEGLVLKLRHDTAVPGYTVKLTISDGESESDRTRTATRSW
jgi:hypothetical protein